jgi:excisionase family DNA binding protein
MSTGARETEPVERRWVKPHYASAAYGIPLGTLYDMIEHGEVPASRVGSRLYIAVEDMEQLMTSNRVERGEKAAS